MYNSIIVDDELPGRQGLAKLIEKYFSDRVKVIGMAASVSQAAEAIARFKRDIVFLDVEMPGQNGFHLFEHVQDQDFHVIFTTAFREYAIDAFKVSAFDYLLKPISREQLGNTLDRLDHNQKKSLKSDLMHVIRQLQGNHAQNHKLAVPFQNGFRMIDYRDILWCEADENYTHICLASGENILVSQTLGRIEESLPKEFFFRVHKSYLINLDHVQSYTRNDGYQVMMTNGKSIPVAFRRNDALLRILKKK